MPGSIIKDVNKREQVSKDVYKIYQEYYKNLSDEDAKKYNIDKAKCIEMCSEESAKKDANDPIKLHNHLKSKEIIEKREYLKDLLEKTQERINKKPLNGLIRTVYNFIKPENTDDPQVNAQNRALNEAFITKISTEKGAIEFINEQIRNISKFNFKEILSNDYTHYIDHYEERKEEIGLAFTLYSTYRNSELKLDSDAEEILSNNMSLIEACVGYRGAIENCASDYYLITPDLTLPDSQAQLQCVEYFKNNKNEIEEFKDLDDKKIMVGVYGDTGKKIAAQDAIYTGNKMNALYEKFPNAKGEFLLNNYIVDKKSGNVIKFVDMFMNDHGDDKIKLDDIEIKEYTNAEKVAVSNIFNNAIHSHRLDVLNYMYDNKDKFMELSNAIKNRSAFFSFMNSDEYNKLIDKIDDLKEIYNNPLMQSKESLNQISGTDLGPLFKDATKALKEVYEKASDYVDAKKDQSKNSTRQFRYDKCIELKEAIDLDFINKNIEVSEGKLLNGLDKGTIINNPNLEAKKEAINPELNAEKIPFEVKEEDPSVDLNEAFEIDEEDREKFLDEINKL